MKDIINISTKEQAEFISDLMNSPVKVNSFLQEALDIYKQTKENTFVLDHGAFISNDYTQGVLDLEKMNKDPYLFATHYHAVDDKILFIQATETCPQLMLTPSNDLGWVCCQTDEQYLIPFTNNSIEYHEWLDPKYLYDITVVRGTVKHYQDLLEKEGVDKLKTTYIDLANTNSLGVIPHLNAIKVVAKRANIDVF